MKFNLILALLISASLATTLRAAITFNIVAADLKDATGTAMAPTSGLVILVADTSAGSNGFSSLLQDGANLGVGQFLNGSNGSDDQILARWSLGSGSGTAGSFVDSINNMNFSGSWAQGNRLALLWFPTLTTSSTIAPAGTTYGVYAPTSGSQLDGSAAWVTPASGTVGLTLLTTSEGGASPNSAGYASLTVASAAPEPSRLMLGVMGLGSFLMRRRRVA